MDGALCAQKPPSDRILTAFAAFFFAGMAAVALWLWTIGDPLEKAVGALALVVGVLYSLCSAFRFLKPPPNHYCLAEDAIRFGNAALSLSDIRSGRVVRRPVCPWLRGVLVELVLELESKGGRTLALPLTYPGWEQVYEALRARRPELGLPRWQDEPLVLEEMARGRGAVRLPKGARILRENFFLGVLVAFFLAVFVLPLILALFPFPRWVSENAGLFAVPLIFFLYHRIVRKRVLVDDHRGAQDVPGHPGG